jgi:sulfate-transporting ATPase
MLAAAHAVIGGVGYVVGPVFGSTLVSGGFGQWVIDQPFPDASPLYLAVVGAVTVLVILLAHPDGLAAPNVAAVASLRARLRRGRRGTPAGPSYRVGSDVGPTPSALEVDDVTVRYGGVVAVAGVSLRVAPGEIVGVIGPNGAGKTSLIDAITGFTRPSAGTIALGGHDVGRRAPHRRARAGLGRSFQGLELFERSTVLENLRVGEEVRTRPKRLAELLRSPDEAVLSPLTWMALQELGLEDRLDRRVDELSYGERRLVAIARALATGPSVLLLDEPVAGLGEDESAELVAVVRRLAEHWRLGVLVVEHDMGFVMGVCDRVLVLDFGRPIAQGPPAEIGRDPAVVAAYLGAPLEAAAGGTA